MLRPCRRPPPPLSTSSLFLVPFFSVFFVTRPISSPEQGPEGVAAAVAGEELPLPAAAAAAMPMGASSGAGAAPSSSGASASREDKVESLADILARADDGPGNLKETFRLVRQSNI